MKKQIHFPYYDWVISFLLALGIWLFFAVFYRQHLHYQEQMQMFMFSSEYLAEQMSRPGGLAIYLGGFFTQFFYETSTGALLLALLLVALRWLVQYVSFVISRKHTYRLLTCIPSLLFAILLLDENMMLSGLIGFILSMLAVSFYTRIREESFRIAYLLLMIPMLYWLAGLAVLIFPLLCLAVEWLKAEKMKKEKLVIISVLSLLLLAVLPFVAKAVIQQYPLGRFIFAGDYYRFVARYQQSIIWVLLSAIAVPLLIRMLPKVVNKRKEIATQVLLVALLALVGYYGISRNANWKNEDLMGYDYYVRMQRWSNILAKAKDKAPDNPLTVTVLNLALSQRDYLPEYMFAYYQNGPEGLLPAYTIDYINAMIIGEIYYQLGQVNSSQRYAFEAMESIPDHQKSVRCMKRLAETNLINGQYEVARKYLDKLQRTWYYSDWATNALACLGDEEKINAHPEWGRLRELRPQEDFLFYEEERADLLERLFKHNPNNKMALEYLLAYSLLTKDLQRFIDNYGMAEGMGYPFTPTKSYQEALALIWNDLAPGTTPEGLDNNVVQRMANYMQIYSSAPNSEVLLRRDYSDTYWYYYHFRRR